MMETRPFRVSVKLECKCVLRTLNLLSTAPNLDFAFNRQRLPVQRRLPHAFDTLNPSPGAACFPHSAPGGRVFFLQSI